MTPYLYFLLLLAATLLLLLWPMRARWAFCAGIALVFCAGGLGLYAWVGSPQLLAALQAHADMLAQARQVVLEESAAVKAEPEKLESWIRLGQAFAESGQWHASAEAFKQCVILSGGQPDLIMAYARALIMEAGGQVTDGAKKSLEMVLLQKPGSAEARYYLNLRLLQDGKTQQAMQAMKKLYHSLPEGSPVKAMIDAQIGG